MTPRPSAPARFARVRHAELFAAALRAPSRRRTEHFALHHLGPPPGPPPSGLSTSTGTTGSEAVENRPGPGRSIGVVVPKRHARRAVTRNLIRRQIYAVAACHGQALGDGCWIVRLRAPFATAAFPSAASPALRTTARGELVELIVGASS